MKRIFFITILAVLVAAANAQNGNFTAMILSLDGQGVMIRNSKEIPLELPQSYYPGDELSVMSGNAMIMLFSGEEIPLAARIIAAADIYNALTTDRPYRKAFDTERTIAILKEMRGTDLDPQVADALLRVIGAPSTTAPTLEAVPSTAAEA